MTAAGAQRAVKGRGPRSTFQPQTAVGSRPIADVGYTSIKAFTQGVGAEVESAPAAIIRVGGVVRRTAPLPTFPVSSDAAGRRQSAPRALQEHRSRQGVAEQENSGGDPTELREVDCTEKRDPAAPAIRGADGLDRGHQRVLSSDTLPIAPSCPLHTLRSPSALDP